jgi:CMP-N-acetylneuraminic acid synthetase
MTRIVALVPMRDQSERVPGKNFRAFAGAPLYHHIVRTLAACPRISEIVIDTDSERIAADAAQHFPRVRVLERPQHLRDGTTPMNDVILHDAMTVEADLYLQTHSTNPLLEAATVSRAIDKLLGSQSDSLFSVTRLQTRLWDKAGAPLNHDPNVLVRTQDLDPVFEENSCLYLVYRDVLLARKNRIGARPCVFEIDANEAWDIDEELDFVVAEFLFQRRASSLRSSGSKP